MADDLLINQLIYTLGLKGKEAEAKRKEIESANLSNQELTRLIANVKTFGPTALGCFSALEPKNVDKSSKIFSGIVANDESDWGLSIKKTNGTLPPPKNEVKAKQYTPAEKESLDRYLGDFLYDSAVGGRDVITKYNNSVGVISFDAAVDGAKVFAGLVSNVKDRYDLQEELTEEAKKMKELKEAAYSQPGAFKSKVSRIFKPYSYENIEKLKNSSEKFVEVTAYKEKYDNLKDGFSEVNKILRAEKNYENAMKYSRGTAQTLKPPKPSSNEKFGQVLLELCNGDQKLVNEYMSSIRSEMGSREDIEKICPK